MQLARDLGWARSEDVIVPAALLSGLFTLPSCAGLDPRLLAGIVRAESAGAPLAIHDDTSSRSYWPRDIATAATLIVRLSAARHAYSVGLMQIENSNWARFGVTGTQLLNPLTNVAVGCSIFRENLLALRAYNTGSFAASAQGDRYAEAVFDVSLDPVVHAAQPPRIVRRVATIVQKRPQRRPRAAEHSAKRVAFGLSTPDGPAH